MRARRNSRRGPGGNCTRMKTAAPARRDRTLSPRREPLQQRSLARAQQILQVSAELLEEVGLDTLTTILIARRSGISVGTLYHYYPNKHAILHAMAERWLREVERSLDEVDAWPLGELALPQFVDRLVERQLVVYREQRGILHLVQAMFSIPELRELDQRHDALVIERMAKAFGRYGLKGSSIGLGRLARAYLELTHALLLVVANQAGSRSRRTLTDLKRVTTALLEPYLEEESPP
jgi:AcrR family transcriptional regulator